MSKTAVVKTTTKKLKDMDKEYGATELAGPALRRLDLLKKASRTATAVELAAMAQKTIEVHEIHLLSQWGRGKIEGKVTPLELEGKAKNCESLARMFTKKGEEENAKKQLEKAAEFRKQALELATREEE